MTTIEMFELITKTQPNDYQSLEILKEAYLKLGRDQDLINTSRRIAQAYLQQGQLSSAILEYESILQRLPDDPDVRQALAEIENAANTLQTPRPLGGEMAMPAMPAAEGEMPPGSPESRLESAPAPEPAAMSDANIDDGRQMLHKIFVESKIISNGDFDLCWHSAYRAPAGQLVEPFIQTLSDRGAFDIYKSLLLLCDKSRLAYIQLEKYDVDHELIRSFPGDICKRWCVLPFDRMCKTILVATANPFNREALKDVEGQLRTRVQWYLSPPQDIIKAIKRAYR